MVMLNSQRVQFSDKQNYAWPPFQDAINEDAGQQFVNQQVPGSTFQILDMSQFKNSFQWTG